MPTYPRLQFVSAPDDDTALVLYDFNTGLEPGPGEAEHRTLRDNWTIGAPQLDDNTDVDAVDPVYGSRTLQFTQRVIGSKAQALAAQSQLARRILAPNGWLLFQLAAHTEPIWFRTYRSDPGELAFTQVTADDDDTLIPDLWDIAMSIPAEPWAYGEWETFTATIANDPAAGTNGCHVVLPEIRGDAPTPLRLGLTPSQVAGGRRWLMSSHAARSAHEPICFDVGTGDTWTCPGLNAPVGNNNYSGSSYRQTTFTATGPTSLLLYGDTPLVPPAGRYKVMLRVARNDTASTFAFQLASSVAMGTYLGPWSLFDRASSTATGHATWLDLGEFTLPPGSGVVPDGVADNTSPTALQLSGKRLSGTGQANIDAFLLIGLDCPDTVETHTLIADSPDAFDPGPGIFDVYDGDTEAFWRILGTQLRRAAVVELTGSFPVAVPGAENVLTLLQQVEQQQTFPGSVGDNPDVIAASTLITVSYQPRWLWIGDS